GNNLFEASQKNHLHFEVKDPNGKYVNPTTVLPPREGSVAKAPATAAGQTPAPAASTNASANASTTDSSGSSMSTPNQ
ncbi:MAG: hypothetical protein JWN30_375, partial [Bacilli bacterium]|nr:hypothetical protein [Bacilli bacterium]